MDISTMLNDLMTGVREAHSGLVDQEFALKEQLNEVVTERRRLESVIKAAQGPQPKQEPEPAPSKQKPNYVSDEMVDAVRSAIMGLGQKHEALPGVPGTFTARDIVDAEVASQPTVSAALRHLRESGEIRVCGTLDSPGAPKAYALAGHDGDGN